MYYQGLAQSMRGRLRFMHIFVAGNKHSFAPLNLFYSILRHCWWLDLDGTNYFNQGQDLFQKLYCFVWRFAGIKVDGQPTMAALSSWISRFTLAAYSYFPFYCRFLRR